MLKILFLCHGNICRSPMAEYVMNKMIADAELGAFVRAYSRALHRDEIGSGVYPPVKKLLDEAGINSGAHRATLMKASDYALYDYIVVMDDANVRDVMHLTGGDPDKKVFKLLQFEITNEALESEKGICDTKLALDSSSKWAITRDISLVPDVADPWYTRNFDLTWCEVNAGCKALLYKIALDLFSHSEVPISNEQMRAADAYTIKNFVPSLELMRRAGVAIAREIIKNTSFSKQPVCILCGKGNNAGDGLVAALELKKEEIPVEIVLTSETFSPDASYYFEKCKQEKITIRNYDESISFSDYCLILDCLFGTGFKGEVRAPYDEIIKAVNRSSKPFIISADINSGLNGDTGEGETFVISDLTIAIGSYKHGHFVGKSADAMKAKKCMDIGIVVK